MAMINYIPVLNLLWICESKDILNIFYKKRIIGIVKIIVNVGSRLSCNGKSKNL